MKMSIVAQVFLLFYAVLYGVLFTISDRWRPFFISHGSKEGWRRMGLSLVLYGIIPIGYFLLVLPMILEITNFDRISLGLAIYAVAPLIASYFLWVWLVISKKDEYYSKAEQQLEPVKSSLEWVAQRPISSLGVLILLVAFYIGPIFGLYLLGLREK